MKYINSFEEVPKYDSPDYELMEPGIYKSDNRFITSLSFQQEADLGEGTNAADISQYPLEDILDRFSVYVSDFFEEKNTTSSTTCYLEFTGFNLSDIQQLRKIIGKHVYNREIYDQDQVYLELVIE